MEFLVGSGCNESIWTVMSPEMDGLGSHGKSGCNGSNAGMHWQNGIGGVLNFASSEAWPSRKTAMEQWELTSSVGALDWLHCWHRQVGVLDWWWR